MELLIPGLILVALMVYVSTRIKRTAAAAYEAETIETDEYVIEKPEGFLHNLNVDPGYIFEAYSKEFSADQPNVRQGLARIRKIDGSTIDDAADEVSSAGKITGDVNKMIDEKNYRILVVERQGEAADTQISYKLARANATVYMLEVRTLGQDAASRAEIFIDSFRVK